jgi:hypothetical protein
LLKKDYVSIVFVLNGKEARRAEIPAGGAVRRTPHGIQRTNKNFPGWPCGKILSASAAFRSGAGAFVTRAGKNGKAENFILGSAA